MKEVYDHETKFCWTTTGLLHQQRTYKKTDIPSVSNKSCKDGADEFVVTLVP